MIRKGRMKYVPLPVLEELDSIMGDGEIGKDSEGFKEMAQNSKIGREIKKMSERFVLWDKFKKKKR